MYNEPSFKAQNLRSAVEAFTQQNRTLSCEASGKRDDQLGIVQRMIDGEVYI